MVKMSLGKGLSALLGENEYTKNEQVVQLEITEIIPNPYQPRITYDKQKMDELIESVRKNGILQPIVVRKNKEGKYEIIFGERRFRSAKTIGMEKIPVIIKKYSDLEALELALVENLQREDLDAIEEAKAYELLAKKFDMTHEEIAKSVGKTRSSVTNTIRLLKLPQIIQDSISSGVISVGHAKVLLSLEDEQNQIQLMQEIEKSGMSVRTCELRAALLKKPVSSKEKKETPKYTAYQKQLREILKTRVTIKEKNNRGKIQISFSSKEELEKIVSFLKK